MKRFSSMLVLCFLAGGTSAYADSLIGTETNEFGFYVEPGLTYQTTQSNVDYSGALQNSSADSRGVGVVAKVGVHLYERFFAAIDARYALINYNDNANHLASGGTSYDLAPVVGYQMKDWGMRLFAGYVVAGNMDPDATNGVDLKFNSPTGFRLGAGMKVKMFSVNVEWQQLHYGNVSASGGGTVSQANIRYNPTGLVASLTFPIEL